MASNKRPRKKYMPKPKFADPVSLAIRGCSPLGVMDIGQFMSPLRGAVSAILTSSAVREDWVCVFDAVNVAEQLCPVLTTGRDWRDWIEQAQADVLAVYEAGQNISDEHAQAMHGIADVFAEMLSAANCRQMFAAQEAAARKVRGALTANSSTRSVRLVEAWSDR